ncbi:hypothetical protein U2A4042490037 [Corynebacterium striatum]|nr:hypothetical protein U2A4042490037 [Corynebacterium striatum]
MTDFADVSGAVNRGSEFKLNPSW